MTGTAVCPRREWRTAYNILYMYKVCILSIVWEQKEERRTVNEIEEDQVFKGKTTWTTERWSLELKWTVCLKRDNWKDSLIKRWQKSRADCDVVEHERRSRALLMCVVDTWSVLHSLTFHRPPSLCVSWTVSQSSLVQERPQSGSELHGAGQLWGSSVGMFNSSVLAWGHSGESWSREEVWLSVLEMSKSLDDTIGGPLLWPLNRVHRIQMICSVVLVQLYKDEPHPNITKRT